MLHAAPCRARWQMISWRWFGGLARAYNTRGLIILDVMMHLLHVHCSAHARIGLARLQEFRVADSFSEASRIIAVTWYAACGSSCPFCAYRCRYDAAGRLCQWRRSGSGSGGHAVAPQPPEHRPKSPTRLPPSGRTARLATLTLPPSVLQARAARSQVTISAALMARRKRSESRRTKLKSSWMSWAAGPAPCTSVRSRTSNPSAPTAASTSATSGDPLL